MPEKKQFRREISQKMLKTCRVSSSNKHMDKCFKLGANDCTINFSKRVILFISFETWIVKEMDRKLVVICDVFSVLTAFKPANYDITKSPKPTRLAIIQLNI